MFALALVWVLLAITVATLAVMRRFASREGDSYLHVSDAEAPIIAHQLTMANRLDKIDKLGKTLTVVTLVYGLALVAGFSYMAWQNSQQLLR
jgi:hypothetical protein